MSLAEAEIIEKFTPLECGIAERLLSELLVKRTLGITLRDEKNIPISIYKSFIRKVLQLVPEGTVLRILEVRGGNV